MGGGRGEMGSVWFESGWMDGWGVFGGGRGGEGKGEEERSGFFVT